MAFLNIQFPEDVLRGVQGGPAFDVGIVVGPGGVEERNENWTQSRGEWEVSHVMQDDDKKEALLGFWQVVGGMAYSFRFKDWLDYLAGMAWFYDPPPEEGGTGLGEYLAHVAPQQIGVGDGANKVFQLKRRYAVASVVREREVYLPRTGYKVWTKTGSAAWVEKTSGVSVTAVGGVMTFTTAPAAGVLVGWSGEFDVPARFDVRQLKATLVSPTVAKWESIPVVETKLEELASL